MKKKPDAELLADFVAEAKQYLTLIPGYLETFLADNSQGESIQEVFRLSHSIKGAASMVGLPELSELGYKLERAAEEIGMNPEWASTDNLELFQETLNIIGAYLERCADGDYEDTSDLQALTQIWEEPTAAFSAESPSRLLKMDYSEEGPDFGFDPGEPDLGSFEPAAEENSSSEPIPPELLEIFALEAEDHLKNITTLLPELQNQPEARDLIQQIRRSAHTLKGSAAMVGFHDITHLSHRMEDLLDQMYEEGRKTTPEILSILFKSTDVLEDLSKGQNRSSELKALYGDFEQILQGTPVESAVEAEAPATVAAPVERPPEPKIAPIPALERIAAALAAGKLVTPAPAAASPEKARRSGQFLRVPIEKLDDLVRLIGELVISRTEFEQRLSNYVRQIEELQLSSSRLRRAATKLETEYEARTLASSRLRNFPGKNGSYPMLSLANMPSYGFDDLEMDRYTEFHLLSRELSETTNDVQSIVSELSALNGDFEGYLTRQTRLSSEVQDKLMGVRMVPIGMLAPRLQRTIRNAADTCGKQALLVIEGENTELDTTVLDDMAEPLLHILRNAVDHGIETPEVRQQAGKPEEGTIRIRAFPEGSQIVLQILDDGRGINPNELREVIASRGIASAKDLAQQSDQEIYQYLFAPGFSTAKTISEISGRGVGLDIVNNLVHKLKGTVKITSEFGVGTTFTIRLPLTLAAMKALLVRSGDQTFALPLGAVKQILRLEPEMLEMENDKPIVTVNGETYPLVHLGHALNLKKPVDENVKRLPVAIIRTGERDIALAVDHLQGGREIVVKNLGTHVRQVHGIAGATIMGDGSVVLIVNPSDLDREYRPRQFLASLPQSPAYTPKSLDSDRRLNVLVVDDSPSVRRVVSSIFKRVNWTSSSAKDGIEALEFLHQANEYPDAIMLDIEMPRMDGYEFLSTIRSMEGFEEIPVVMVTSRAGDKHRRKAMELGANAYLVKPYQDDQLIQIIRDIVRASAVSALY